LGCHPTERGQQLQGKLQRTRPEDRSNKPAVAGVENNVKEFLRGRHMKDLFSTQETKTQQGLPRVHFQFRKGEYRKWKSTLIGKTILFHRSRAGLGQ
jgi:hypothetical protein